MPSASAPPGSGCPGAMPRAPATVWLYLRRTTSSLRAGHSTWNRRRGGPGRPTSAGARASGPTRRRALVCRSAWAACALCSYRPRVASPAVGLPRSGCSTWNRWGVVGRARRWQFVWPGLWPAILAPLGWMFHVELAEQVPITLGPVSGPRLRRFTHSHSELRPGCSTWNTTPAVRTAAVWRGRRFAGGSSPGRGAPGGRTGSGTAPATRPRRSGPAWPGPPRASGRRRPPGVR